MPFEGMKHNLGANIAVMPVLYWTSARFGRGSSCYVCTNISLVDIFTNKLPTDVVVILVDVKYV